MALRVFLALFVQAACAFAVQSAPPEGSDTEGWSVRWIYFSDDGRYVIGSGDAGAYVWDLESAELTAAFDLRGATRVVGGSPTVIVSKGSEEHDLAVFDLDGKQLSKTADMVVYPFGVSLDASGTRVLSKYDEMSYSFSSDGTLTSPHPRLELRDTRSGEVLRKVDAWSSSAVALSPDANYALAISNPLGAELPDYRATLWRLDDEALVTSVGDVGNGMHRHCFTRDSKYCVFSDATGTVRVLPTGESETIHTLPLPDMPATRELLERLNRGEEGPELASLSERSREETASNAVHDVIPVGDGLFATVHKSSVRIWNPSSRELQVHLRLDAANGSVFSPSGDLLATNHGVVDVASGRTLWELPERGWRYGPAVAFHPEGERVAFLRESDHIEIRDAQTGSVLQELRDDRVEVEAAVVTPDGSVGVLGCSDGSIRVFDIVSGNTDKVLEGHTRKVVRLNMDADGSRVISGSSDGTARVWSLSTGEQLASWSAFSGHSSWPGLARLSPDGTRAVTTDSGNGTLLWDVSNGSQITRLEGAGGSLSPTFSPDGQFLATATEEGVVRFRDGRTGALLDGSIDHGARVSEILFDLDAQVIVTSGEGQRSKVWGAASHKLIHDLLHEGDIFGELRVRRARLSNDKVRLLTVSGGLYRAHMWDLRTGTELWRVEHDYGGGWDFGAAWSEDESRVLIMGGAVPRKVVDAETGATVHEFGEDGPHDFIPLPGGQRILGTDDATRLLDARDYSTIYLRREFRGGVAEVTPTED